MNITPLEQTISEYCNRESIMGMVRVTQNEQIAFEYQAGWANAENKTPFDSRSMFSFYSLSKPFCAMGLMKLVDTGKVSLEDHPGKYVPEAAELHPDVTLRMLVTHTSGIPDFEQIPEFAAAHLPGYGKFARAHLKEMTAYPQFFAPGTGCLYTNINFVLPALVCENVSGLPWADYVTGEVLRPLGMTAVVDNENRVINRRVTGYELQEGKLTPVEKSHNWLLGAGDLVGTVDDAYALHRAVKEGLLLSPEAWQQVLTPSPICDFGIGCSVTRWHGKKRITHNGGHLGFRTLHIHLPAEDFDLIILSNSGFGDARGAISEMVYEAFFTEHI